MPRKILLIEPNYKNKYPPMGLMKISYYHKLLGDEVTFFKGTFSNFIIGYYFEELIKDLYSLCNTIEWIEYETDIKNYVFGKKDFQSNKVPKTDVDFLSVIDIYRNKYRKKDYKTNPIYDRICITTLFTFYWKITINTINDFKVLCKSQDEVKVGGISASLLPEKMYEETGIYPHVGLLDEERIYDDNDLIIDTLPLDYSILNEIEYSYTDKSAYYSYMTRGCVNKCSFCAVPTLEPLYCNYINLRKNVEIINTKFGTQRNLLLLDNNVFASTKFNQIIDEIKELGFKKGAFYQKENPYEIAYRGLISSYNDKAYKKSILNIYFDLLNILDKRKFDSQKFDLYKLLNQKRLLHYETMDKENIVSIHNIILNLSNGLYKKSKVVRYVDFNQGLDARLATDEKLMKLSEICIKPLRIAFDSWELRQEYEMAIRKARKYEITYFSNYILYNYLDKPEDLYLRLKLNIDLCEELDVKIFSFPMKYHPIKDPEFFDNRLYTGKHWNRKFIRSIQAVLNSTKGKVGRGRGFFEKAFGKTLEEFNKLLYMPETMIIYRLFFEENGLTNKWWLDFNSLQNGKKEIIKLIIEKNDFKNIYSLSTDQEILNVLKYYTIKKDLKKDENKAILTELKSQN